MVTCTSCGSDVTGKKFCPHCGTPVQSNTAIVNNGFCPRCNGEVNPGAAYCPHCGSALHAQQAQVAPAPSVQSCPSCHAEIPLSTAFCTNCGYNLRSTVSSAPIVCTNCGRQNGPGMKFCGGCGSQLAGTAPAGYTQPGQYPQQPQYQQPQYQPATYQQPSYPLQYAQGGYQPQPMMGQGPMVLRCPTCMAIAPMGTPYCASCRTSLAGVVPIPANMPQGQQQGGLGGFLQGSGGQLAAGALGGAAAVIGGELLLNGLENSIENRVEGDMGMGYGEHHHHHHHRDEGLLGGLGDLANDIGL